MRIVKLLGGVLSAAFVVLAAVVVLNFQGVYDWYRLRNYTAPAEIAQLAEVTAMTEEGKKLFFVNHPELIKDKATFRANCQTAEQSIVLGCYVSQLGIYIYDVEDERLAGIEEVTAAHEMLHVGYERLSDSERIRIDALTEQAFQTVKSKRIQQAVEQYRQADATVVPNELHSIMGTEVATLPAELEVYYQRYFSDRAKVVALANSYENAFAEREARIASLDSQLEVLEQTIQSNQQAIDGLEVDLTAQRTRLDRLLEQDAVNEYNAGVASYNSDVRRYNELVETTSSAIDRYNALVAERNAVTLEERELYDSLDSRTIPSET